MTGSGKTGLCIDLIEEAALDGVPAIMIDPKGDITNLLLNFPRLRPEDFLPWSTSPRHWRKGQTPDEFATVTAKTWHDGLASSEEGPDRIRTLESRWTAPSTPRFRCRPAREHPQQLQGAQPELRNRNRDAGATASRAHLGLPGADRRRGRSGAQQGAHSAFQHHRNRFDSAPIWTSQS